MNLADIVAATKLIKAINDTELVFLEVIKPDGSSYMYTPEECEEMRFYGLTNYHWLKHEIPEIRAAAGIHDTTEDA